MAVLKIIEKDIAEHYSDGDQVESEILEYVRNNPSGDYTDVLEQDQRWPVFYHLTDMREGILNWYDFTPGCDVLEIGAGMGALTGLLCRNAGTVTSVELTLPRARVIEERCKRYDNLTILVGNFNRMEFSKQFDYITLIGVLEYAPGFTESGDPADFLRRIRSLLKPDGKLLVAIENRFGLKYWCGAAEDHTGKPFSGINGYPDNPQVRTWSHNELSELLIDSGFEKQKFFYPLPDYKLPQVLYSDEYYPKDHLPGKLRNYRSNEDLGLAVEEKVSDAMLHNNAFSFMANSFFVECGSKEVTSSPVSAAFFSPDRIPSKQITTVIDIAHKTVEKLASNPAAKQHLGQILKNQKLYKGSNLKPYRKKSDRLRMPFIEGESLDQIIYRHLSRDELDEAKFWMDRFYQCVLNSSETETAGEDPVLAYGFLDMVFQNCFVQGDSLVFYDQEWVREKVPASFILFRAILIFYAEHPEIARNLPQERVFSLYSFSEEKLEEYEKYEETFAEDVIRQRANPLTILEEYCKKDVSAFGFAGNRQATVYFNTGSGYSEESAIHFSVPASGLIDREWELPEGCVSVRFDPVEDMYSVVQILEAVSDNGIAVVSNSNGENCNSATSFLTTDPQVEFVFSRPTRKLRIRAEVYAYDDPLLLKTLTEACQNRKKLEERLQSTIKELGHYKEHYFAAINQREDLKNQLAAAQYDYAVISNAFFWKLTKPMRTSVDFLYRYPSFQLAVKGMKSLKNEGVRPTWDKTKNKLLHGNKNPSELYSKRELALQRIEAFPRKIKFSIVVPLYNTPEIFLKEMIRSVKAQTYSDWELCLADGSDAEHENVQNICQQYVKKDKRIKYQKLKKNLGISGNTNACLEMSTGDYIALFDHDDLLHPAALHDVMKAICEQDADFIYTDENSFHNDPKDAFCPHFKQDYAPDSLRGINYICHLTVFKKSLLEETGLFRPECDGSQDYDMVLRLTEKAQRIVHIPEILYYWRAHAGSVASDVGVKPYVIQAAHKAIGDHLERIGLQGQVLDTVIPSVYRIKYEIIGTPLVSIMIPNYEHKAELQTCLDSIFEKSTYPNFEIIVIENNSRSEEIISYYEEIQKKWANVKVVRWTGKFNYSAINNFGASCAKGEHLLLLNNDIEVITPDWIQEMLMFSQRADVGAVGAMLYYPDNTIQHAGVIVGLGGVAGHSHKHFKRNDRGYMYRLAYAQNLTAVTAACLMVKKAVWDEVGGLDEDFQVAFNDVDFCMRVRRAGYLNVWTPFAELYHYESKSRGYEDTPEKQKRFEGEIRRFQERWVKELAAGDPYYNPNLTLDREDFSPRY